MWESHSDRMKSWLRIGTHEYCIQPVEDSPAWPDAICCTCCMLSCIDVLPIKLPDRVNECGTL